MASVMKVSIITFDESILDNKSPLRFRSINYNSSGVNSEFGN
jgi:hypothetical protein